MCGIAGSLSHKGPQPVDGLLANLRTMNAAIRHRGPDDDGVYSDGVAGLAHARLSVIDLSMAGHQPMQTPDGHLAIIFNGEIYNHTILRRELESLGHSFMSRTDTEVILLGFRAWGTAVFKRLRGMFALAIWDSRKQELTLARDHIGKKPLCYATHDNQFLFASEIKAILQWPGMPREADMAAIHDYLTWQYVSAPASAFRGIHRLPQGHFMVVRPGQAPEIQRYTALPDPKLARSRPAAELQEELLHHLREAVQIRLMSDVPLGAFLSGGVDSSAVVAMMAETAAGPIKTYCVGFEDEAFDERRYARMVADRYATQHTEYVVRPNAADILPNLIWHYGEPFADPSAIPTYYVSALARQSVTVILNGDGGDENFLGYSRYRHCWDSRWIDALPMPVRHLCSLVSRSLPAGADRNRYLRFLRRKADEAAARNSRRYAPSIAYFSDYDKEAGYGPALRPYLEHSSIDMLQPYFDAAPSYLSGAAWADIHTYLPDDLLVKVDIASMAHSLEARSPFLDQELMAWAAGISDTCKFRGGESKALLKAALEPYLPHEVLYRPKMGFGIPLERWIGNELKELLLDTLLSQSARERGLFRPDFVERQFNEHVSGIRLHHTRLWGMLMLEMWFQAWIDGPLPASPANDGTNRAVLEMAAP